MAWKEELNKEELGAVERLNKLTNKEILYGNRYGIIIEDFKRLQKDIVIVLSRLEENLTEIHNLRDVITSKIMHIAKHKIIQEKNKEIKNKDKKIKIQEENYKNLIADVSMIAGELGLEEDATIDEIYKKIKENDKEDLEMFNTGWQVEVEKILSFLSEKDLGYYKKTGNGNYRKFNKEDWKNFFEEEE